MSGIPPGPLPLLCPAREVGFHPCGSGEDTEGLNSKHPPPRSLAPGAVELSTLFTNVSQVCGLGWALQ